jgi:NADH-quinone oxidoreductase subunit C
MALSDQFIERVSTELAPKIINTHVYVGELTITVEPDNLLEVMATMKNEYGFDYLSDIGATDHFSDEQRFEVFYNIFNLDQNQRLRVRVFLEEDNPEVETVTPIWGAANWHEREAYDMMGIHFRNHPDLRRMFMPEDFEYYPMRKEFPLIGIPGSIEMPEKDPPKEYK